MGRSFGRPGRHWGEITILSDSRSLVAFNNTLGRAKGQSGYQSERKTRVVEYLALFPIWNCYSCLSVVSDTLDSR